MAKVEDIVAGFGEAIVAAQRRILRTAEEAPALPDGSRTAFSISQTELELKMIFDEEGGTTGIKPVSAGTSRLQDLDPGVLSTLKATILVVPDETRVRAKTPPENVRNDVLKRPDIQRLAAAFGDLTVNTNFVPSARRWLVDVVEPAGGLVLRSLQIDD